MNQLISIYLAVLLLYVLFRLIGNRGFFSSLKAMKWEVHDTGVIILILFALQIRIAASAILPIGGDEASNLEPNFWTNWFLNKESHSSPPLFRFLIHMSTEISEHILFIRLSAIVFGAWSIWLLYRLGRRRSSAWTALVLAVVLAFHGDHFFFSTHQKAYTLWLCLLLAAQTSFLQALEGDLRKWRSFALCILLAALTHYFTMIYLAGWTLYLLIHRRDLMRKMFVAAWPALAASIPFLLPILQIQDGAIEGSGIFTDPSWPADAAIALLISAGGLGFALMALAAGESGKMADERPSTSTSSSKYLFMTGLFFPLIYSLNSSLEPRMLFPLLPFGLLWIAPGLEEAYRKRDPYKRGLLMTGAALLLGIGLSIILPSLSIFQSPIGYDVHRAVEGWQGLDENEEQVFSSSKYYRLVYELSGKRMVREDASVPDTPFFTVSANANQVISTRKNYRLKDLEKVLDIYGSFDFFRFSPDQHSRDYSPPSLETWLLSNCRLLVDSPPSVFADFFSDMDQKVRIYRCSR